MKNHVNDVQNEQAGGREKQNVFSYPERIYRYCEMDAGVSNEKNRVEIRVRLFEKPVRLL